jgi:TolB-like protein/class 3 adenylate cyclase
MPKQKRQLAAIMFTDIVGYTALMDKDEELAFKLLQKNRSIHKPNIEQFQGKFLKEMGDGILASFTTVSDAVYCAGAIQKACESEPDLNLRIGIHQGEVVSQGDDVFGSGVNIASRIEAIAPAGRIWVSDSVQRNIQNKKGIEIKFVKEATLKNVTQAIRIFEVMVNSEYVLHLLNNHHPGISESIKVIDQSIAVLPFVNMSSDPEQDYFSDGMMEDILTHLYKIGELKVTARTSVMGYKGTTKKITEIGKELGVAHILEGSVRKSGDRVKITVQLISTKNDHHLWAESYDRKLTDVFAIQGEVAQSVALALKAVISPEVKERIEILPTENLVAYDLYLKGNDMFNAFFLNADLHKVYDSLQFYQKAIELDKNFSYAYIGMGRSYWMLAHWESSSLLPEFWKKSKYYLNKAIRLDPYNGDAYSQLSLVSDHWDWDSDAAKKNLDMALKLWPNKWEPYWYYFWHDYRLGNCDNLKWSIEELKRMDPNVAHPCSYQNLQLLQCQKKYVEITLIADEYFEKLKETIHPDSVMVMFDGYLHEKEYKKANEVYNYINESFKLELIKLLYKAILRAKEGQKETAMQILDSIKNMPEGTVPNAWYAIIYAALEDKEKMYESLEKALKEREWHLHDMGKFSAVYYPYKEEPQFREILRKMWIPWEDD